MKHKLHLYLIIVTLILVVSGCGKNKNQQNQANLKPIDTTDRINIDAEPIAVNSLSEEEIKNVINGYKNFKIGDDFYINIPKSAPVLEFVSRECDPVNRNFDEAYKEFLEIYRYFFPEHEMDESLLICEVDNPKFNFDNGEPDYDEPAYLKLSVTEDYDELRSGDLRIFSFIYDESGIGSSIYFEMSCYMAWGDAYIDKGTVEEKDLDPDSSRLVGVFSPYSTETFKLADKEVPINQAVDFYESYINNIPYPEKNLDVVVAEVWVYKADEDTYEYLFINSATNHGIMYDYRTNGFHFISGDDTFYNEYPGYGIMTVSDDVGYINNYNQLTYMDDVKQYESMISLEDSLKIVNESMTSSVEFEVLRAEMVYTLKSFIGDNGYTVIDDGRPKTTLPCWKFMLYNENDNKTYNCYVNAKDGTFRYVVYTNALHGDSE